MTSKQRAYLKGLAMTMDPIFQIGKSSLTPENTAAIAEALEARELIKISVLQNCMDDPNELAQVVAERTRSQVVQVIGKNGISLSVYVDRVLEQHFREKEEVIRRLYKKNYEDVY